MRKKIWKKSLSVILIFFMIVSMLPMNVLAEGLEKTDSEQQYYTNFNSYETGTIPNDWSSLWKNSQWTVLDEPSRLEHVVDSSGGRRLLTWDEVGEISGDVEVSGLVRATGNDTTLIQLHLHGSGAVGSETSYYLDIRTNGSLRINKNFNGFKNISTTPLPFSPRSGEWYQVVLQREGNTLRGKAWEFGELEPEGWNLEVVDQDIQSGHVGVGHASSGMTNEWAFYSVGIGGTKAPRAPEDLFDQPSEDNPIENLETGFEKSGDRVWTTYEEEQEFLAKLAELSDRIQVDVVGYSGENRPIHLVKVGYPAVPTDEEIASGRNMLIMGTVHGNEPSGREMSLKLMRDLAFSEDPDMIELLEKTTIMFIPTANPDGREADVRRNKDDYDLNRDQLKLITPEAQTIARVQKQFTPDITIDAHEQMSGPNIALLGPTNLNTDRALQELNDELVDHYMFPALEEANLTNGYYASGSGSPSNSRNMPALKHGIAVLVEASWGDDPATRVAGQMVSAESVLKFYKERFDDVVRVVQDAPINKKEIGANRSEPFYLEGGTGNVPSENYILNPPPYGYLINEAQVETISRHIELFSLETMTVNNGVYITMDQPMMTVIPLMMDENSRYKLVNGLAVYDLDRLEELEPPAIPEPMQYETNFSNYEVNSEPYDWSTFWRDSGWVIKAEPNRLEHYVTDGGGRRLLTWDKPGEVHGDVEISTVVRASGDGTLFQLHLHGTGVADDETSYYIDIRNTGATKDHVRINRNLGSRFTVLESSLLPFTVNKDTWYEVVFNKEGNELKAKVWPFGEQEPENWHVTVEDTYIDYGYVGVGHVTSGITNDWAYFSVGTAGEQAPRAPRDLLSGVDKSILQNTVEEIKSENLDASAYTTSSWQALENALEEAERVLESSNATQLEVDEALEVLKGAREGLTLIPRQYETSFHEYENGDKPHDWTSLWRNSQWTVLDEPSRLEHIVDVAGGRRLLTWDEVGIISGDVEVSGLVRATGGDTTLTQLHLHGSGSVGSEASYYLDIRTNGSLRINKNFGGFKNIGSTTLPFTPEPGVWYQLVLQREGNMLRGKAWPFGESEPTNWNLEVEDHDIYSGQVGIGHVSAGMKNEWAFFSVGTGGNQAVRAPENIFDPTPEVDKTVLQSLVDAAKSLHAEEYTAESWQVLEATLSDAEDVLENQEATQEEVNEAVASLQTAMAQLQEVILEEIDKTVLQSLVDAANSLLVENYTEESWQILESALSDAEDVLENQEATQEEVDEAVASLQAAIAQLQEASLEEIDKTVLQSLVDAANSLHAENYTEESWQVFEAALSDAKGVLENQETTQEEVDEAVASLQAAMAQLKAAMSEEGKINKTELQSLVDAAKSLNKSLYTEDSWGIFEAYLLLAIEVLNNKNASQEDVDNAFHLLKNAFKNLKEIDQAKDDKKENKEDKNKGNSNVKDNEGSKLPKTATSVYNLVFIGLLLLVVGSYLFQINLRRVKKQ